MDLLRNFLAIPVAAILGVFTPGIYIWLIIKIESFLCYIPFLWECSLDGGYILFLIPEIYFWLYMQTFISGGLAGITIIYVALAIAKDENNLTYISLFLTSLLITIVSIYGNVQKELYMAIPFVISNLITFVIAGLYPLYIVFKNKKLSDELDL